MWTLFFAIIIFKPVFYIWLQVSVSFLIVSELKVRYVDIKRRVEEVTRIHIQIKERLEEIVLGFDNLPIGNIHSFVLTLHDVRLKFLGLRRTIIGKVGL